MTQGIAVMEPNGTVTDLTELDRQVKTLKITSPDQRAAAAELFDVLRTKRKQIEAAKESTVRPLITELDHAKAPFDVAIKLVRVNEQILAHGMGEWDRKVEVAAQAEQDRINKAIEAANAKAIAKADKTGDILTLKAPVVVQNVPKTTQTAEGAVTRSTVKAWKIRDLKAGEKVEKIPANDKRIANVGREFLVLDVVKINAAVKNGIHVSDDLIVYDEFVYGQRAK